MSDLFQSYQKICLDSCSIIYFIEDHKKYAPLLASVFKSIQEGKQQGYTSYISLIEVLIKPLQENRLDLAEKYRDALCSSSYFELYEVGNEISELAAKIRADHNIKVPDAIQLATAEYYGADLFITNDPKLKKYENVNVQILEDCLS